MVRTTIKCDACRRMKKKCCMSQGLFSSCDRCRERNLCCIVNPLDSPFSIQKGWENFVPLPLITCAYERMHEGMMEDKSTKSKGNGFVDDGHSVVIHNWVVVHMNQHPYNTPSTMHKKLDMFCRFDNFKQSHDWINQLYTDTNLGNNVIQVTGTLVLTLHGQRVASRVIFFCKKCLKQEFVCLSWTPLLVQSQNNGSGKANTKESTDIHSWSSFTGSARIDSDGDSLPRGSNRSIMSTDSDASEGQNHMTLDSLPSKSDSTDTSPMQGNNWMFAQDPNVSKMQNGSSTTTSKEFFL